MEDEEVNKSENGRNRSQSIEHVSMRVLRSRSCTPSRKSLNTNSQSSINQTSIDNYIHREGNKGRKSRFCDKSNSGNVLTGDIKGRSRSQSADSPRDIKCAFSELKGKTKDKTVELQRQGNTKLAHTLVSKNLKLLNKHDKALACQKKVRTELFVQNLAHNDNVPFETDSELVAIVENSQEIAIKERAATDNNRRESVTEKDAEISFKMSTTKQATDITLHDLLIKLNSIQEQLGKVQTSVVSVEANQTSFKQQLEKVETTLEENKRKMSELESSMIKKENLENMVSVSELQNFTQKHESDTDHIKETLLFHDLRIKELSNELEYLKAKDINNCMILYGVSYNEGENLKSLLATFFHDVMLIQEHIKVLDAYALVLRIVTTEVSSFS